jgi:hypothetical protein
LRHLLTLISLYYETTSNGLGHPDGRDDVDLRPPPKKVLI